ncbi:MAG: RDD family protein [Ferruginibacter sp.]|nr:RDD family protein [Cytophagales bacterium]
MPTIRIQTTQNVVIEYQPASVGDRILAYLLDQLILAAYLITASLVFVSGLKVTSPALYVALVLPYAFYGLLSEIFLDGQTLGKRQMKIKVVKLDGTQPSVGSYLMRWLLSIVDFGIFGGVVAVVVIVAGGRGQRIGDLAAGTAVVSLQRRVSLEDTRLPTVGDTYEPTYYQAANLSDRDVGIIREALQLYENSLSTDFTLVETLAQKVKELLGVENPGPSLTFLRTVLRDHTYLTAHA